MWSDVDFVRRNVRAQRGVVRGKAKDSTKTYRVRDVEFTRPRLGRDRRPAGVYPARWPRGIQIERIKPGHPEQNGRHERMHLTLKQATTRPPAGNLLQQQAKFDDFVHEYNYERPHQALDMKCPADFYRPSQRPYRGLPDVEYPLHQRTITVTSCGRICLGKNKINLSQVFAGQKVSITEVEDNIWLVSFMHYDIGYFDLEACRVESVGNPFDQGC